MTNETFETILRDTFDKIKSVLLAKADEYAADGDRLHNFKRAAHLQGKSPVGALAGMMCKHTVSIYDLIEGYEAGRAIEPELWDEKIIDNINYLILLRAVLREERENAGCEYCGDEFVPALNWQYGLDHILPDYKYCPMCGRNLREE